MRTKRRQKYCTPTPINYDLPGDLLCESETPHFRRCPAVFIANDTLWVNEHEFVKRLILQKEWQLLWHCKFVCRFLDDSLAVGFPRFETLLYDDQPAQYVSSETGKAVRGIYPRGTLDIGREWSSVVGVIWDGRGAVGAGDGRADRGTDDGISAVGGACGVHV